MAVLPPWLNITPSQFTDAAIAGGQLGQRTAQEAGELAQRGIIAAQEIANRAEQLQVQRESIAAELAGRQAAASQRAAEAQMENAIKQQMFDLNKSTQDEISRRMGEKDAAWQEGMSRYERAVNSGDTAAAADAEILQPLRSSAETKGRSTASRPAQSEWSVVNTPSGPGRLNKVTGEFELGEGYKAPAGKMGAGGNPKLGDVERMQLSSGIQAIDRELTEQRKLFTKAEELPNKEEDDKVKRDEALNLIRGRMGVLERKKRDLFASTQPSALPPIAATAVAPPPMFMPPQAIPDGAPTSGMFMGDPMNPATAAQPSPKTPGLRILKIRQL